MGIPEIIRHDHMNAILQKVAKFESRQESKFVEAELKEQNRRKLEQFRATVVPVIKANKKKNRTNNNAQTSQDSKENSAQNVGAVVNTQPATTTTTPTANGQSLSANESSTGPTNVTKEATAKTVLASLETEKTKKKTTKKSRTK
jgi:hypothetical protein